jgi:hypothetical protein
MDFAIALALPAIVLLIIGWLSQESDIDIAVKRTKILDARLVREFSAQGETFEEHIKSAKGLPEEVVDTLHNPIRLWRNDVVHKVDQNKLKNRQKFIQACDYVEAEFDRLNPPQRAGNKGLSCLLVSSMLAAFAYFLAQTLE